MNDFKCNIVFTKTFKKQYKKIKNRGWNLDELMYVVQKLANLERLDPKYRNHNLIDDKTYKSCKECHISPDWLLIYKYLDNNLVLLLVSTGSHSDLFE